MSSNTESSQRELREQVIDVLARRGVTGHLEDNSDPTLDAGPPGQGARDSEDKDGQQAVLDTLKEKYTLETLNTDTEVQAEIDALERRIKIVGDRAPEHVAGLRVERDALEAVKGGRRVTRWSGVRRQINP